MRVPLSWLGEYVDVDLTPEQLAERFTVLGMEVKGIIRWGDDWRNVVVGELLSVEKHPRSAGRSSSSLAIPSSTSTSSPTAATCCRSSAWPARSRR